jgi:hypothetical protein
MNLKMAQTEMDVRPGLRSQIARQGQLARRRKADPILQSITGMHVRTRPYMLAVLQSTIPGVRALLSLDFLSALKRNARWIIQLDTLEYSFFCAMSF